MRGKRIEPTTNRSEIIIEYRTHQRLQKSDKFLELFFVGGNLSLGRKGIMKNFKKSQIHTAEELASFTPRPGEILMNSTLKTVVIGDGITPGGNPLKRSNGPGVFMYLTEEAETTTPEADTFIQVGGAFDCPVAMGFCEVGGVLEYTEPGTLFFEAKWNASLAAALPASMVCFGIAKNGEVLPDSLTHVLQGQPQLILQVSGGTCLCLDQGDKICPVFSCAEAGRALGFANFTMTLRVF